MAFSAQTGYITPQE